MQSLDTIAPSEIPYSVDKKYMRFYSWLSKYTLSARWRVLISSQVSNSDLRRLNKKGSFLCSIGSICSLRADSFEFFDSSLYMRSSSAPLYSSIPSGFKPSEKNGGTGVKFNLKLSLSATPVF